MFLRVFLIFQLFCYVLAATFNRSYTTLNVSYKKFKPNEIFEVETYGTDLYIGESTGTVHQNTFVEIPEIIRLMVFKSNFAAFDFKSLHALTQLESVNLYEVLGTSVLSNSVLKGMTNLKTLSIYRCDVRFEPDTFQQLKRLEYLSISGSDVAILGNDVFRGSRLKELYWTDSGIEKIDKLCFAHLQNVEVINLSRNKLEYLDLETFRGLRHLERLYLNSNQLAFLDFGKQFQHLPALKYLDVSLNKLAAFKMEEVTQNLPNLTTIIVDKKSVLSRGNQENGLNVVII